jgi:hypothetical protein
LDQIGGVTGASTGDYDGDGATDLFLSVGGETGANDVLCRNRGDGTFEDASGSAGGLCKSSSFGSFFFDYDNDGRPDVFTTGFRSDGVEDVAADFLRKPTAAMRCHLYRNRGNGVFEDVSRAARLDKVVMGVGLNYGDLDNDGYLDICIGTGGPGIDVIVPNRVFRNAGGRRFQDVTTAGDFGHLQKGGGVAFADLNNDGHQDLYAKMGGVEEADVAYSAMFANPYKTGHWIGLKLEGSKTNRSAIGAAIKVTIRTAAGRRKIWRTVSSGGSLGAGPLRLEIGLGDASSVEAVEIFWPASRSKQVLRSFEMDRFYNVREGEVSAKPMKLSKFSWPGKAIAN